MTVSQCELVEVEGTPQQREKTTLIVLNVVDATSGMHIASIKSDISHSGGLSRTVGFVGLVRRNVSELVFIVHRSGRNSLIKPKDVEFLCTLFLLKLTGTWWKSRTMREIFA